MKKIQSPYRTFLQHLPFGLRVIRYALTFASAFFRSRASLGCELVALKSQLAFYKANVQQRQQARPRFSSAFRLLWILLSKLWGGWRSAANLMQPDTVIRWDRRAFRQWWSWKSRHKAARPAISKEVQAWLQYKGLCPLTMTQDGLNSSEGQGQDMALAHSGSPLPNSS